jgi:GGDEF domain-containing protein
MGQHLSGWVAANRQSIVNSDPSLDFGDAGRRFNPRLRSCLSCPLISDAHLVGVLSLYSDAKDRFSEDHRRILEAVAGQIAHNFKRRGVMELSHSGAVTVLDTVAQLEQLVSRDNKNSLSTDRVELLVVNVLNVDDIAAAHGGLIAEEAIRHVTKHLQQSLRAADNLFRYQHDQLVALLNDLGEEGASIRIRVIEGLRNDPLRLRSGGTLIVQASLTTVSVPRDSQQLGEALKAARSAHDANSANISRSVVH